MRKFRESAVPAAVVFFLLVLVCSAETPSETMARVAAEMRAIVQAARSNANSSAATAQEAADSADSAGAQSGSVGYGPMGNGPLGLDSTNLLLAISSLTNGVLKFSATNGVPLGTYDLYFLNSLQAQNCQWRRVYTGAQMDGDGKAAFALHQPDPNQGFFVLLSEDDSSGDALGDGYKAWFNYSGRHMIIGALDSDGDQMLDIWEVEYGLDPTDGGSINVNNGPSGNPDGDAYLNLAESTNYDAFNPSFDPLKFYCTTNNRPVVLISGHDALPSCQQATFTISRFAGCDADYSRPLTVYYSVGGSLSYDQGDYTLSPAPPEWPRIYSVDIPATNQSVTVTVNATNAVSNPSVFETLNVSLTPYSVSPVSQVSDPTHWNYVVHWPNNRATITYQNRPLADCVDVMTGINTPVTNILSGSDSCGDRLAFAIVPGSGPTNGTLGPIIQIDDTHASVIYTPVSGYAGPDGFQYTVGNPVSSLPAPVTINVVTGAVVTTYCHTNQIAVHWVLPPWLPAGYANGFKIFRCETNSGSCVPSPPPAAPYATVINSNISTYLDTAVTPGETYCYTVTFSHHFGFCPATNVYESPLSNISCNQECTNPAVLISANTANSSHSTIDTYHFQSGGLVNMFVPDGGINQNGRGIAIHGGQIFYTGLLQTAPIDSTDSIRVCPYGAAGSGGNDITNLTNPRPGQAIQDLDYHSGALYALTGYHSGGLALEVHKLDPTNGTVLAGPISIASPATQDSDAFVVLPNGNFLINTNDLSPFYYEFNGTNGALVTGGLAIDLTAPPFNFTTGNGVALSPDGQSLYFSAGLNSLVQTNMVTHQVVIHPIGDNENEDIDFVVEY